MTAASTIVLIATERTLRRVLPLVALLRLSLVFPDEAPSRFKVAMRTNTLRQLQRDLEHGEIDDVGFQQSAEVLVSLAYELNVHDRMTRGHTERVRAYTLMIGEELGLSQHDLDRLHWAGLVHDIGKLDVPPEILNKPGRPSDEEWSVLRGHPAAAEHYLEPLRGWLGEWANAATEHHERWDGGGYPRGLAGEQISLSGRIVAVADAFDVMTSVRSYKRALSPQAARAELARSAGTQFDPEVVRAFLNISVGRLRLVMGPLSWLAQAPVLGNIPIGSAAVTAASALVSVGISIASGVTDPPVDREPAPPTAAAAHVVIVGAEDEPIRLERARFGGADLVSVDVPGDVITADATDPWVVLPAANWFGTIDAEYEGCRGETCTYGTVTFEIRPVNDAPAARPDGATTPGGIEVTIDVLANDVDVEDGTPRLVSVTLDDAPPGFAAVVADGMLSVTPPIDHVGPVSLTYTVADRAGAKAIGKVVVDVLAAAHTPEALDDIATVAAGSIVVVEPLANDIDPDGLGLRIVDVERPDVGDVTHTDRAITYRAPTDPGAPTVRFGYVVESDAGIRSRAFVTIDIVVPPSTAPASTLAPPTTSPPTTTIPRTTIPPTTTARPPITTPSPPPTPPNFALTADTMRVLEDAGDIDVNVLANDNLEGVDASAVELTLVTSPTRGQASVAGLRLRYRPMPDTVGADEIVYRVCAPGRPCSESTLSVTITPVNDAPRFRVAGATSVAEDSGAVALPNWVTGISPGATGEQYQNVAFTAAVDRPEWFTSLPAVDADGTLRFRPAANAHGTLTLTVTAVDDGGMEHGGTERSDPIAIAFTIRPVNDSPTLTGGAPLNVAEDSGPTTIASWLSVTAGANEPDQIVTVDAVVDRPELFAVAPAVDGSGTLTFVPAPDASGTATLVVSARDDGGTDEGGMDTSTTYTTSIALTPVNDAPVAAADAATVDEDDAIGVDVDLTANDGDVDGDLLTITAVDLSTILHGTVSPLGGGRYRYVPDPHSYGPESFSYTVSDPSGATDTTTVTITVMPQPDAPTASGDAYTTSVGTPRSVPAPGVLANDYDEDGDPLTAVTTPISGPTHGVVVLGVDGSFTYTPDPGYHGTDQFEYEVTDTTGRTDRTTVSITVDSGLTPGQLYLGSTPTLGVFPMVATPPTPASPEPDRDGDGQPGISVTKGGAASTKTFAVPVGAGGLQLNGPVNLTLWSAVENFELGKDGHPEVTLYDCDWLGLLCTEVATTDVHIDDYHGGTADWVMHDIALGNVTHTFAPGRQIHLVIEHRHRDLWIATSGTRPSRLTYTIANTAPTASADTAPPILEDASTDAMVDVLANDTDTNLDPSSLTITVGPAAGTASVQPDRRIAYRPHADVTGTDSLTYQVCDTQGLCDTATVTFTITPVNDAPGFDPGPDLTLSAADPAYVANGWATNLTAGPADEATQSLNFTVSVTDPSLFATLPTIDAAGTISFTPSGVPGTTTLTITVTDDGGTANGGTDSASRTATITLT